MDSFTHDQKMAMLVVPVLLFGILGVSYGSSVSRALPIDENQSVRRASTHQVSGGRKDSDLLLKEAIESGDYDAFIKALHTTPYHNSANREVFDTLTQMYALHTNGDHAVAGTSYHRALYGDGPFIS